MKDKLAKIIQTVNYVKASAVNTKLITKLCKDMDFNYGTAFSVVIKVNMLAHMYEMKDELMIFFLKIMETRSSFVYRIKRVSSDVGRLLDIFEALNVLNLVLQGKNTNGINDYDTISTFVPKLELVIVELKKEMQFSFLN